MMPLSFAVTELLAAMSVLNERVTLVTPAAKLPTSTSS